MRTLLLVLFTFLAGSAAAQDSASPASCKYDEADCRDGCTVDYGGSSRTYAKLGACLKKCKRDYDRCLENQFKAEQEKLKQQAEPTSADAEAPGVDGEVLGADAGTLGADGGMKGADAGPEPTSAPESKSPKPGTKASDSKQPALEDTSELDRLYDEQQPPPPPQKSKSKPKAAPEKKGTDDWAPAEK
ncbi:MAG TPA: hypothetical protein VNA24_20090 [Hyalangium sp.]|nr:hypothetical protein [Hyalangium sp.]